MNTDYLAHQDDKQWQAIVSASEALLKTVQEGRWEDLEPQARYRDKLIRSYFATPVTVDNALRIHEEISGILEIDERILGHARREQVKTSATVGKWKTGTGAGQSYQSNSR